MERVRTWHSPVRRRATSFAMLATLAVLPAAGCDAPERPEADAAAPMPVVAFDTATVRIETAGGTHAMVVEVAERPDQRSHGLMERSYLDEDSGMIFIYSEVQDGSSGFWMYRTLIPLDIAFLDEDGTIVSIMEMEPCRSPVAGVCRIYSPGVPYAKALEANRGYFTRRGIEVGDRVVLERGEG